MYKIYKIDFVHYMRSNKQTINISNYKKNGNPYIKLTVCLFVFL